MNALHTHISAGVDDRQHRLWAHVPFITGYACLLPTISVLVLWLFLPELYDGEDFSLLVGDECSNVIGAWTSVGMPQGTITRIKVFIKENRYRVGAHCPSVQGLTNASDVCETELLGEVRCDLVEKCITQTLGDISDDERQSFYTCYVTVALFYSLTMVGASTCSTTSGGKGGGLREPSSESASRSCSSSPPS
ncbi:hypothetical protein T492DRAFT_453324 [Pavlovales sp. CCMP2436]|nr:hypothetical protein T492DRAFT_453324 [Pavlovales sp. CCMP2436]